MTRGPTTSPMTNARIARTIMISSRVMPRWAERRRRFLMRANMMSPYLLGAGQRTEVHDGLQDREHDERDGAAHHHEHQRLEQRREPRELGIDFGLVGDRDALEHLLELAGALADRGHVDHRGWELARFLQRRRERFALGDRLLGVLDRVLDEDVTDDLLRGIE